jgi:hypothetical protein
VRGLLMSVTTSGRAVERMPSVTTAFSVLLGVLAPLVGKR